MPSSSDASSRERWTLRELLDWTCEKFESIGIDQARTDAQYLLASALGCSRMQLYVQLDRLLDRDERQSFREMVRRRLAREPVAYIEGRRGFHALDLDLEVNPSVLVPRPETEHLVDWALESLKDRPEGARVLDVGTGSGAIALAIKRSRPQTHVVAVDLSVEALETARSNAKRLELEVDFHHSDLLSALDPGTPFDLICANLPYIPHEDLRDLAPEVRDFEPQMALDGGPDGLRIIERLVEALNRGEWLTAQGSLLLEFGIEQADGVEKILKDKGFAYVARRSDYAGIERVIRASQAPFAEAQAPLELTVEAEPDPRALAMQALADSDDAPAEAQREEHSES